MLPTFFVHCTCTLHKENMSKNETFRNRNLAIVLIVGLVGSLFGLATPAQAAVPTSVVSTQVATYGLVSVPTKKKKTKKKSSATTKRAKALKVAKNDYKGVRYRSGGTSRKGWDCSGFVTYVYKKAGAKSTKSSRWTTRSIRNDKKLKRTSNPKPGDIVYNSPTHVGIYIGKKNGKPYMISARNPSKGTTQHPVKWGYVKSKNIKYYTIRS